MKPYYFLIATITIVAFYMLAIITTSIYLRYRNDPTRLIMIGLWVMVTGTSISYLLRIGRMLFSRVIPFDISRSLWMLTSAIDTIGLIIVVAGVTWLGNWLRLQGQDI